jgi:hypothetical protein
MSAVVCRLVGPKKQMRRLFKKTNLNCPSVDPSRPILEVQRVHYDATRRRRTLWIKAEGAIMAEILKAWDGQVVELDPSVDFSTLSNDEAVDEEVVDDEAYPGERFDIADAQWYSAGQYE